MHKFAYASRRYRQYVEWIALNDNPGNGDNLEEIAAYISTTMLAHVNEIPRIRVAADVAAVRREESFEVGD